jgi:RNA polymerase sigma-70 factor, ECF subfamily
MVGLPRGESARVRGARAGSAEDIEALFRAHWPRAYRAAYLVVHDAAAAEDIEALFRAHWPRAYRAAYLVVHDAAAAEDIAQEAFLAAVRALDRFDNRRPFAPWLHRIVVNRAIDWARARALRRELGDERLAQAVSAPDADGRGPVSDEVIAALARLAPDHRAVIVLRYLLEYTPGEIASLLDVPRGTVNSRLRRGLDALAAALGEEARS